MIDLSSHLDHAVILLAVVGAFHTTTLFLRVVRISAAELRNELHEWRKFFRGG